MPWRTILTKKSISAIKKAGHSDRKKPVSEVTDGLPRCHALALLGSLGTITADTKKVQNGCTTLYNSCTTLYS
jgi:hypothetical protein